MTFAEIIAKISGADPSKQYNMSLEEIQAQPTQNPPTTPSAQAPAENTTDSMAQENSSSTDELESLKKTIAEQNKAIDELKKANLALLSHTPAEKAPDIDELILKFAGYSVKEEENGNN